MIKLRKNPFSETEFDIPFQGEESLKSLFERAVQANGYELSDNLLQHFQIILNGHKIDQEFWEITVVKESDSILIGPRIARGSGGQLFKQVALVAIAVAAAAFGQEYISGWALQAAFVAGVTIASTLALNALIPPPGLPGLGGLGGLSSSFEGSQMYTITSQQNNAKKFGYVPRVYGTHRIFPLIAANPYTDLEADPVTGTIVQYFYCIYDFGFGPLDIQSIKIGETDISDYADTSYRLVDLNKPAVSEGDWDDRLFNSFQFYKGDVERDGTIYTLNDNQSAGGPLAGYQFVRTASDKVNGSNQEISLDFVCPQGLIAYATNGDIGGRNIDLKIEFSKVGEDVWIPFNDVNYVYDYRSAGGSDIYNDYTTTIIPFGRTYYSKIGPDLPGYNFNETNTRIVTRKYGYKKGVTVIPLADNQVRVGEAIYFAGNYIGTVSSITSPSTTGYAGFSDHHLTAPNPADIVLWTVADKYRTNSYGSETLIDTAITGSASQDGKIYGKRLSLGGARIYGKNTNPVYATFKFRPKEIAQYKVRVTRVSSSSTATYRTVDALSLTNLSTRFDRNPIITDKRHVFLEIRIKATNQINGAVNNLSAIATSILDVYDPDTNTWSKQGTNNPAWVFCDLLTGSANKKAISKDRLHTPTIVEWAEYCDEIPIAPPSQLFVQPRFQCNFVLDFDTTLQALIQNVAGSAHASLNIVDGKYGVLLDKQRTTPVQIFTPRNSRDFSSIRAYSESPDALKIRYVDPFLDWDVSETIVYDSGFDADTAINFEELSTFACTNPEQAWRFGRYMLAQARLRKETISITVDFEYLVCTRGDFVQISQDVMRVGGRPARVKTVVGNRITIDDGIDTIVASYGYTYRGADGVIVTNTLTVVDAETFDLDGTIPEVGDLIIIGVVGSIVMDCIVKSIIPTSDLSATLTLVEKADAIYDAESTDTFPAYDPQINPNVDSSLATPPAVENLAVTANTWRFLGSDYQYYVDIDWDPPVGAAYESFEIYVDSGAGYELVDLTKDSNYEYIVDAGDLGILHSFKVLAVSSTGKKINLIEAPVVTATPVRKTTAPSNVDALFLNITGEVLQLDWSAVADVDIREYLIRYTPKTTGATWEASIPLLRTDRNTTLASTQARTGTYLIKAVDYNSNESAIASLALTTIPNLFNLNVISETNDFPTLTGELVNTKKETDALILKNLVSGGIETNQYYSFGYYYYNNFLDLGEIYTVRLQSLIEAEGYTAGDLMSNWVTLDDVLAMSNAKQSEWDVETQYRTTDSFNVMSDWLALSDIDPISEGVQDNWTDWKKFIIGDATGRIFQFRLKLISNIASVTPRVFDGVVRADMPDRTDSYNNIMAPDTGYTLTYTPAFKGPGSSPNIQITQDAAQSGDRYVFTSKTLDGFTIRFYDSGGNPVARQFDVLVKGYGRKADAVI